MVLPYRFVAMSLMLVTPLSLLADEPKYAPIGGETDKLMRLLGAPPAESPPAVEVCERHAFDFSKTPPATPLARFGNFIIPPSGCHYYTLFDWIAGRQQEAPRFPFGLYSLNSLPSYEYDFRYLDNPDNKQTSWTDSYKRMHLGDDWLTSLGGEFRTRYANERNSQGSGITNDYTLLRTRLYGDAWYRDEFRMFVEFIYAETFDPELPPLSIDGTGPDLLNAFFEVKVGVPLDTPAYLRIGRQEVTLGSQRLISIPDWANIRRTFQGVRGYWHSESWNVDAFWLQPVLPNRSQFDSVDTNRNFFGLWTTYKVRPGTALDVYYLGLTKARDDGANGDVQTLGGRYSGDVDGRLLFDTEGAVQFGERDGRHIFAQMATGGLGWRFKDLPGNVHAWVYYDYASGDKDPANTAGSYRTFDQLFAFGHYYFGFLDLVARQNIRDLNFHLMSNPVPWMTTVTQLHIFKLDSRKDALYNAIGVPIRRDPTGLSGDDVGTELDFTINFHLTMQQDLYLGYSKLFAGDFWKSTGPPSNPDLVYAQYTVRW
jgi:hypothetical protein